MKTPARAAWDWFEYPHRLRAVQDRLQRPGAKLLDVGCGNHSPSITKRHFPALTYHGIDPADWNRDEADAAALDVFYRVDIEDAAALATIPDHAYDAIICSHVLEHLQSPADATLALLQKLAPGGAAYFEVPSARSLTLPRAQDGWRGIKGCLNFWDDPTHTAFVDLHAIASRLSHEGWRVRGPFPRRMKRRLLGLPIYAAAGLALRGYIPATVVWDAVGFAEGIVVTAR